MGAELLGKLPSFNDLLVYSWPESQAEHVLQLMSSVLQIVQDVHMYIINEYISFIANFDFYIFEICFQILSFFQLTYGMCKGVSYVASSVFIDIGSR